MILKNIFLTHLRCHLLSWMYWNQAVVQIFRNVLETNLEPQTKLEWLQNLWLQHLVYEVSKYMYNMILPVSWWFWVNPVELLGVVSFCVLLEFQDLQQILPFLLCLDVCQDNKWHCYIITSENNGSPNCIGSIKNWYSDNQ